MLSINLFEWNSIIFILFLTFIIGIHLYSKHAFNYWKSKGIDGPKPIPLLGTTYQIFFNSMREIGTENTKRYGKIHGLYIGYKPVLSISDPQLIKDITIKDFHIFVNRTYVVTGDPLNDKSLFFLKGDEWKRMRSIISPAFSSGKMKKMYPIIVECVQRLQNALDKIATNEINNETELKSIMARLTLDVIASCAFGARIDVYNELKTEPFVENAKSIMKTSLTKLLKFVLMITFPKLGLKTMDSPNIEYFTSFFKTVREKHKLDDRDYNNFFQILLNAMQSTDHYFEEQELESEKSNKIFGPTNTNFENIKKRLVTEDELMANALQFLMAGYETTDSFLGHFFYSLSLNEKCQQKLFEEIKRFNGYYDYENMRQMPYLEACVAETLRLYHSVPATAREASQDYVLGNTGITISKGTPIILNANTVHHSSEYYPDPEKWDPERFMPENQDKLVPYSYMPFGLGPRNCVGMRFALMESKIVIAYLVNRFEFVRTANTKPLTKPKKYSFLLKDGEMIVGLKLRTSLNSIS